jgi:leucyl-tRNA synthetase
MKRTSHGMILGEGNEKMSKSRGNVVNPDEVVAEYGADTLRLYEMFIGDFEKTAPWSSSSIKGCKRFLDRIWALQDCVIEGDDYRDALKTNFHKTIKKVSEDIEGLKFNTAIATMMALLNDITATKSINKAEFKTLLILLNPFAPHITEELYQIVGFDGVLNEQQWVTYDEALCIDQTVEIVVQVNGKIKTKLTIPVGAEKDEVLAMAKADEKVQDSIQGKNVLKEIYVPNKLVNFVAK